MRSYAAEILWPDSVRRRASANLRSAIWRVRQQGHNVIRVTGGRLGLAPSVAVDIRDRLDLARRLLDRSIHWAPEDLGLHLSSALSGELLIDWFDEWLLLERDRWNQLRLHALEALAERLLACGDFSYALQAAIAAVWVEPLRESAHRILIRIHASEGNWSEAIAEYERYRRLLHRELSTPPTAQMEELIQALMPR
jgi:DNA-binding SARP family transcriptional activator